MIAVAIPDPEQNEQNTVFYEFVKRRGARGFGSANIKALHEAVERDRLSTE